jgi:hypothetical protein
MQAANFRDRLLDAKIREVPVIVQQMRSFRSRLRPLLQSASRDSATKADSLRDLAIQLALLSVDESHVEPVLKHLLSPCCRRSAACT